MVQANKQSGFTLIEVLMVVAILGIISAMALPRLLMAKQSADASSAISSLRTINSSQEGYQASCGGGFYSPDLTTLGVSPPNSTAAFISPDLSYAVNPVKSGYTFQMLGTAHPTAPSTCNGLPAGAASRGFKVGADPGVPTNYRYFATNSNMTIYEDTGSLWAATPEVGVPLSGHPLE